MPLADVRLNIDDAAIPGDVERFLAEAERRIEVHQRESRVPGFVASDAERTYRVLESVAAKFERGGAFCEWGSGLGVITCMAAMLDFDAVGIEIEEELVEGARQLARDFEVPAEFLHGSFLPHGCNVQTETGTGFAWLKTEEAGLDELPFDPDDFDVIFAYPWPDEEDVAAVVFERYAKAGALLVTYHGGDVFRLRRKVAKKSRR
jgi:predicted O-methyltransferase YrrM